MKTIFGTTIYYVVGRDGFRYNFGPHKESAEEFAIERGLEVKSEAKIALPF